MEISTDTLFSTLSNEIRLRCLMLLHHQGELCVCELTHALHMSQPMISRHLALLRDTGLVNDRRAGRWVYYSINAALSDWVKQIFVITAKANKNQPPFADDLEALMTMPDRAETAGCG